MRKFTLLYLSSYVVVFFFFLLKLILFEWIILFPHSVYDLCTECNQALNCNEKWFINDNDSLVPFKLIIWSQVFFSFYIDAPTSLSTAIVACFFSESLMGFELHNFIYFNDDFGTEKWIRILTGAIQQKPYVERMWHEADLSWRTRQEASHLGGRWKEAEVREKRFRIQRSDRPGLRIIFPVRFHENVLLILR